MVNTQEGQGSFVKISLQGVMSEFWIWTGYLQCCLFTSSEWRMLPTNSLNCPLKFIRPRYSNGIKIRWWWWFFSLWWSKTKTISTIFMERQSLNQEDWMNKQLVSMSVVSKWHIRLCQVSLQRQAWLGWACFTLLTSGTLRVLVWWAKMFWH